jgi:hypothetical protein
MISISKITGIGKSLIRRELQFAGISIRIGNLGSKKIKS